MKSPNKHILFSTLILLCASVSISEDKDPYVEAGWEKLREFDDPEAIQKEVGSQKPIAILTIEKPKIDESRHLLTGEVAYRDVSGSGFLGMWTHYSAAEYYFSRTLGEVGPMAKLTGSSEYRRFILPFNGKADAFPEKLQFNVVLPGGGEVEIRNLKLYQRAGETSGAWWKPGVGKLIGMSSAAFIGAVSSVCAFFAYKGQARSLILPIMILSLVLAAAIFIIGMIGHFANQPGHLTVPLLLSGGIGVILVAGLLAKMKKHYLQHELQLIAAAR